jgi:hypothetical protein
MVLVNPEIRQRVRTLAGLSRAEADFLKLQA